MKQPLTLKNLWQVVKNTMSGFSDDKLTKLSGSLAYYTVFSMGPLLVVLISLCGIFLGREAVEGRVYRQLDGFLGHDTALQLQDIIKKAAISGDNTMAMIIGGVMLLLGATTVFAEIQDSINGIWGLKPKPKHGWLKMLQNRFLSFSVIVSLGFLLLVSLALSSLIDGFNDQLQRLFPDMAVLVLYIVNQIVSIGVVTMLFAVIFRVLPDAKIRWKDVMAGALITAALFMLGKFAISFYISTTKVGTTYGAAGSLVIVLLWTYYSSLILYIGAEFTKAYAIAFGAPILPNSYAVTTKEVEIETGKASVQSSQGAKD